MTVIVGDLVSSRKIEDRRRASKTIRSAMARLNKKHAAEIYAPLTLTRGIDELSGVLRRTDATYRICRELNEAVAPQSFRFAIVRNDLDVAVNSKDAAQMDGRAFHKAADMIQLAKRQGQHFRFDLGLKHQDLNLWINELANLAHILRSSWTGHQRKLVELYAKLGNQEAVAKRLGITQQAVSVAMRQAHWREVERAERLVDQALASEVQNKAQSLYSQIQIAELVREDEVE
jgi:hypothetical protein